MKCLAYVNRIIFEKTIVLIIYYLLNYQSK